MAECKICHTNRHILKVSMILISTCYLYEGIKAQHIFSQVIEKLLKQEFNSRIIVHWTKVTTTLEVLIGLKQVIRYVVMP